MGRISAAAAAVERALAMTIPIILSFLARLLNLSGIGKAVNGGFGLVLDGSRRVDDIIRSAMNWDVMGGVARRNWARNPNAMTVAAAYNRDNDNGDQITLPFVAADEAVDAAVDRLIPDQGE